MDALRKRVEAKFDIRFANHWSEMRGGSYLRWPRTHKTLLERLNPWERTEAPPFGHLLIFRNGEVDDPDHEPFVQGYAATCYIAEVEGVEDPSVTEWFIALEGAALVRN